LLERERVAQKLLDIRFVNSVVDGFTKALVSSYDNLETISISYVAEIEGGVLDGVISSGIV
jgi:hypothetical protein